LGAKVEMNTFNKRSKFNRH